MKCPYLVGWFYLDSKTPYPIFIIGHPENRNVFITAEDINDTATFAMVYINDNKNLLNRFLNQLSKSSQPVGLVFFHYSWEEILLLASLLAL